MDRLERLVNLVAALIDTPRPLTRAEIGERIDGYADDPAAFRRNFERDKDLLRQMGFPLVMETPDGAGSEDTGYRIPRELYELPDPGLDEDELTALRLAASVVQLEGEWSDAVVRALRKLGGAVGDPSALSGGPAEGRAGAPVAPAGTAIPTVDAAAAVFAAIGERRRVQFSYRGQTRSVDPWRLSFARGNWYLSGFDHGRGGERQFRLDRVDGPVAATGPSGAFAPPGPDRSVPPPPWRMGDEEEITAVIRVDAEQSGWAARALGPGNRAVPADAGATLFEVAVTNRRAFISFVLGLLDHAEIVSPPQLRSEVVEWLEALI